MTPAQRAGQLVMAAIRVGDGPGGLDRLIGQQHIGGVIFLGGGWAGAARVRAVSQHVQGQVTPASTAGVGMLLAADQEGGQIEALQGPGFTPAPPALDQGRQSTATISATSRQTGRELAAAGVNVDLAPVADTVPASLGRANDPIGRYSREYGTDPGTVSRAVTAAVHGLRSGGVAATVKHFPGLGRVTGNTDVTAAGTTDGVTTPTDPYLEPFRAGIAAGAQLVMVSSARYPRLDPANQAVFSPPVVTGLLRGGLGFAGVVITDDVGLAKSVSAVAPGERATRFVGAGGDVVITAEASLVPAMTAAITARAARDAPFAAQVGASARRVVALKQQLGLVRC